MDIERFIEHKFEELLDEIKFPKSTLSTLFFRILMSDEISP